MLAIARPERIRHETRRRPVEVVRVEAITPNFVAVTFGGESLDDFRSLSFDDHIKVILSDGADEEIRRDYTPRRFDKAAGELTIEFFTHSHGVASEFAQRATTGMKAAIGGPKSSIVISPDYASHLLAGDETALPAIHRRLEELPEGARVLALIKLEDAADKRTFDTKANAEIRWLAGDADLPDEVAKHSWPSDGFVWCAGEASVMRRVRDTVLKEKGHSHELARIAAYWRKDAPGGHEVLT
jgi:NADPH-dependent ferric siderophore reductase